LRRRCDRRAAFHHPEHLERIYAEDQARDDDDDQRTAAQANAAAAREPARKAATTGVAVGPVLDVVAAAEIPPSHDLALLVRGAEGRPRAVRRDRPDYGFNAW
jgi:hypothetical protein